MAIAQATNLWRGISNEASQPEMTVWKLDTDWATKPASSKVGKLLSVKELGDTFFITHSRDTLRGFCMQKRMSRLMFRKLLLTMQGV